MIYVLIWLACAVYTAGTWNAYFQRKFLIHNDPDLFLGIFYGLLFGPVGAIIAFFFSRFNFYGWSLRCNARVG